MDLCLDDKGTKLQYILKVGIFIVIVLVTVLASVPPISRDALVHHLAVPQMYINHGGMIQNPSMDFSYFPMNLDLLYMIPLFFDKPIAAKYIHFSFAILTAWLINLYLKKKLGEVYGLAGALLFLTIPIVVKLSVTVYVDLGLIFFSWASIYYFFRWQDNDFKTIYLIISAIFCGLCLGTKYNGLIFLFIMISLLPVCYSYITNKALEKSEVKERYKNSLRGLKFGLLFAVVALLVFSPWMIRNTVWKQNPVFPLYKKVFSPQKKANVSSEKKAKQPPRTAFWTRRHIYKESFGQTLLIPIRAFFQGQDDNPKYFDGKLNPTLLLLPLFAFVRIRRKQERSLPDFQRNFLALFSVLFITFVLFQVDFRIRYMSPAIPPLVVLTVFGFKRLVDFVSTTTNYRQVAWGLLTLIAIFTFSYNGLYIFQQFNYIKPIEYLTGEIDKDTYITRYRSEHPVIMHANQVLPEDARVLFLSNGKRTYYLDRDAHLARDFYKRKNGTYTKELILKRLKRYGTTHVIFRREIYLKWIRTLHPQEISVFEDVFKDHTNILFERDDVQLLEIV